MNKHVITLLGVLAALWAVSCATTPTPLSLKLSDYRPLTSLADAKSLTKRFDPETGQTYLSIPTRFYGHTMEATGALPVGFNDQNWSNSVKQEGRVQVYIAQTPDFYEVVEQELPRSQKSFNSVGEAIAYANHAYPDWPLVSLEP